jgi:hypothetical protein
VLRSLTFGGIGGTTEIILEFRRENRPYEFRRKTNMRVYLMLPFFRAYNSCMFSV